jgi:hypothetical protein
MPYNVYLFNGLPISPAVSRTNLSAVQLGTIQRTLQGYFDTVVRAHDALRLRGQPIYVSALVQWLAGFVTPARHELLIYLLPVGATLASNGKLEPGNPPAKHDGLTKRVSDETASEVYFHFNDMTLIANLMFHEAMHNKLGLGNEGLHSRGGMANGLPGGTGPITPNTPLSQRNIDDMARGLDAVRPQWIAGMRMLANEWMKSDNDPSKGLF